MERGVRKIKREKSDRESRGNGLSGRDRKGGRIIRNLAKTGRNKLREWSAVRKTTKRSCLSLPLRSCPIKVSGPRRQSVYLPEERGLCRRQRVADKGCVYGTAVGGRRGWQQRGVSLSPGWPCWRLGGDAVVRNCKPDRSKGALFSIGGGGGGEKGKLGTKF